MDSLFLVQTLGSSPLLGGFSSPSQLALVAVIPVVDTMSPIIVGDDRPKLTTGPLIHHPAPRHELVAHLTRPAGSECIAYYSVLGCIPVWRKHAKGPDLGLIA